MALRGMARIGRSKNSTEGKMLEKWFQINVIMDGRNSYWNISTFVPSLNTNHLTQLAGCMESIASVTRSFHTIAILLVGLDVWLSSDTTHQAKT
jgi:hypothetical protein